MNGPTNPGSTPDPRKDQAVRRDDISSGWISGSGGPLPRWHVTISHDNGDVFTYLISAENEIIAATMAGAQHGEDGSYSIAAVDVEMWTVGS